jgi:hypothetical protein
MNLCLAPYFNIWMRIIENARKEKSRKMNVLQRNQLNNTDSELSLEFTCIFACS